MLDLIKKHFRKLNTTVLLRMQSEVNLYLFCMTLVNVKFFNCRGHFHADLICVQVITVHSTYVYTATARKCF